MPNVTKKTLVAALIANCGLNPAEAKRVVESVLHSMKSALAEGKDIDLGRLGVLSVATRAPMRRINRNLKHVPPTIENVYRRHAKTVRLTRGKDLSESPQPTIVHKKPQPAVKRSFAVAFPSWRRRMR